MPGQERVLAVDLAHRLRDLRITAGLNQNTLAAALNISVALISSWESKKATPPVHRLGQYAEYFGRDAAGERGLRDELIALRDRGASNAPSGATQASLGGSWHFGDASPITIITSRLSSKSLTLIPDAEDTSPDYLEAYKYGDLDALIELHGHIRAANPFADVKIRIGDEVVSDELADHIVVLGGTEYNSVMKNLMGRIVLPLKQEVDEKVRTRGYFEVTGTPDNAKHSPVMEGAGDAERLLSDVALFYRAPNPNNVRSTLTVCNGMFARGTYGAVRALTDKKFRSFNEQFIRSNVAPGHAFGILFRVEILNRQTMTPDWTSPTQRLHMWSE